MVDITTTGTTEEGTMPKDLQFSTQGIWIIILYLIFYFLFSIIGIWFVRLTEIATHIIKYMLVEMMIYFNSFLF